MRLPRPLLLIIAALLATLPTLRLIAQDDDLAKELPRIKPLDPKAALASFAIQHGFTVDPIATEPLVLDPVAVCYDEDNRLYVVEMRGYPYPENSPTGYIRRLEDTDNDGKYDKSSIFVPGLSWPTGIVPYDGGVFIAVAPEILYAKDTNGDGVADVKKVMFSGFGTQNVQGLLNGLLWGPDGWIYGVASSNGGEIKNHAKPDARPVSVRGRDFRFKPDGSAFEAISGGGQFGHSFDDWGHRFTCNNSNHIRQIVLPSWEIERNPNLVAGAVITDIAVEGPAAPVYRTSAAEPWRIVRTRQRAADPTYRNRLPATELVATGFFTSATGVTIYRGDAYPPEFRGNAFIGDVGGNMVHRKIVSKHGASFQAVRADRNVEFLTSTDNWFRPVNFANTPSGTLLILDMYRETIEHPFSIPEPIKKHLDLTSGKDLGRLYELLPPGGVKPRQPRLGKATTAALVALLADPAAWWRETAQRLLIERRDPAAIPLLKAMAKARPTALGRAHALWTLDVLRALVPEDLAPVFADGDPNVREQAARLAETRMTGKGELIGHVLALADDPDPMVRFQSAFALGGTDDPRKFAALAKIARRDAQDRWTRAAILSAVGGHAARMLVTLDEADPDFRKAAMSGRTVLDDLAELVGCENSPESVQAVLDRFSTKETPARLTRVVVLGLGRGLQRSGGSLRSALSGPAGATLGPVFKRAASVASADGPLPARVDSALLLALGPVETAIATLPPLLDARQPTSLQLAAIQSLAALPDERVGPTILERWRNLSPAVRGEAIEALLARADRVDALLAAIEAKTLSPAELDPARRKQLLTHPRKAVRDRAATLLAGAVRPDRGAVFTQYKGALTLTGDRAKGMAVFRKVCATCHKAEGFGQDIGPNLATVTGRTPEDLLIHILDPNREVPPNYVNYSIATTDGRVFTGLIAEESANAVTLKRAEGATDVVPRARIEAIASSGQSLMPEGLEKGLEPNDFADLIAYLRSLLAGGQTGGR